MFFRFSELHNAQEMLFKSCKTNYATEKIKGVKKVSVFRFPSAKKEQYARNKWIQAIKANMNNNSDLHVTENSVVCEKNWPFFRQLPL